MANDRFGPIDFDRFHQEDFPPASQSVRQDLHGLGRAMRSRPIAFRLEDGRSYTYVPDGP